MGLGKDQAVHSLPFFPLQNLKNRYLAMLQDARAQLSPPSQLQPPLDSTGVLHGECHHQASPQVQPARSCWLPGGPIPWPLPRILLILELCMSGKAWRIFRRSSLAHTMKAFMGLLMWLLLRDSGKGREPGDRSLG